MAQHPPSPVADVESFITLMHLATEDPAVRKRLRVGLLGLIAPATGVLAVMVGLGLTLANIDTPTRGMIVFSLIVAVALMLSAADS